MRGTDCHNVPRHLAALKFENHVRPVPESTSSCDWH